MEKSIIRHSLHMLFGAIIMITLIVVSRPLSLIMLFLLFLIAVLLSLLSLKIKIPLLNEILKKLGKKEEAKFPGKGFVFFLAGCLLTAKLFPSDIALASIAVLTFGDPTASIARKVLTKKFYKKHKDFAGLLGCIVAFFVASIFVSIVYAAIAAIVGMLVEALRIKIGEDEADDNLFVPIATGTSLYVLRFLIKI
ncbi:MAG: hypothetical protein QXI41_00195 [Candidatus Pacearchaeota archaeon]